MPLSKRKIHILVIEDNPGDFVLIEEYLQEEIHTVTIRHAKTFTIAKNMIAQDLKFDVILLDLTLPDASGENLISEALKVAGDTPLIVLTGYANKGFSIKTLGLGVADYLLKDDLTATQLFKSIAYSIERKRVNNELKGSEEKYRNLFHSSPLPTWVYDPDTFMFLDVNEAACRHYGYSKEEFLSMSIKDIRAKEDVKRVEEIVREHKGRMSYYEGVFDHYKKNGELIRVNIQSNNITFSGQSARLVVSTDITEKIRAESALKLSEQRFKALVQDGSDLICILDTNGNYKYVSPTSGTILGIPPEDLVTRNTFDFIHEDDRQRVMTQFTLLLSKKRIQVSPYRFKTSDNTYRWLETIVTNMTNDPSINGIVANSKDVSQSYTYEEKLRKQEALFRAIIEKGSDMKTLITPEGEIIFGTPSITRILGYTPEEYIGKNEKDIIHPDDVEELFKNIRMTSKGEKIPGSIQLRVRSKSGEYRWCEKTITNLLDDPHVGAIVCDFWDITEKKNADLRIKESNDRYNLVSKATSDAIWDYTFNTNKTYIAGTGYKHLFGYDIVNEYTDELFWEQRLHPEDKEEIIEKLRVFIADQTQTQCSYEYRFLKANGTYAYVNDRLFIIRENGIPVRLIGAINDITQRKEEEQHLKLLESVITNAGDAVMITEADFKGKNGPGIIYVNEAFTKMSGYSKNEMIGKTPDILLGPQSDRKEMIRLRRAFKNHEACNIEMINYTKCGAPYWVEIDAAPVTGISGRISHVIAIQRDITNRKIQEQEREKLIFELIQNNKDLRQFSYITSHNLRGPIASLMGLTSLLANYRIEDPTLLKILEGIKKAASRFDETIKDLTAVLNIKDRLSIPKEELNLSVIYKKTMSQCESFIKESGAIIENDFSKAPALYFNKAYLESILLNLLTNAVKYRSATRVLAVKVTSEEQTDEVVLKFKDNGMGFDKDLHKEKLFGLYQRFHEHVEGKGMGLFLIKSQMEALNGTIEVDSKVDEGTLFTLKFRK